MVSCKEAAKVLVGFLEIYKCHTVHARDSPMCIAVEFQERDQKPVTRSLSWSLARIAACN